MPEIPEQVQKDELSQLAQQMPEFTNDEDFRLWAENNPDAYGNFLNIVRSLDEDDRFTGALARVKLSIGLTGQNLSPSVLSAFIANGLDDINVYHVLREITTLKDQGTYFYEYYREVQRNEMIRVRVETLLKNPRFSDGQRSSVQRLYVEIWG